MKGHQDYLETSMVLYKTHIYLQQLDSRLLLIIEVGRHLQSIQCLRNNIITVYINILCI